MRRPNLTPNNAIVALMALSFVAGFMIVDKEFWLRLALDTDHLLSRPWTLVTYPFATFPGGGGIFVMLFLLLWLYQIGGEVERDLGGQRYTITWIVFSILSALLVFVGAKIIGQQGILLGPTIMSEVITVLWATRRPMATVMLYGILPIQARWLALIGCLLIFLGLQPALVPFAALTFVAAWAFAANKLPFAYGGPPSRRPTQAWRKHPKEDESYFADVKRREKEREERERLRKLFESSLDDSKDDR